MQKLRADWVFATPKLLRDTVLEIGPDGTVQAIRPATSADADIPHLPGLLCPAFVNAHCHLELSHLKGALPRATGMAGFVTRLQSLRSDKTDAERQTAIAEAAQEMWDRGISAVGDICNGDSTRATKAAHSRLHWHNFIEVFGSAPARAEEIFLQALELAAKMGDRSTVTLHAPYSVSRLLRDTVHDYASTRGWRQSIHLLESQEERQLFADLEGPLMDMLRGFGLQFQGHLWNSPIDYILEGCDPVMPLLLVHNTEMQPDEVAELVQSFPSVYFVLCPLANQFIHETLPAGSNFAQYPDRVCLGTDSLAGNDRLDIYSEMQVLQAHFDLETELLLRWATVNGAQALGVPEEEFVIAPGSRPQLLHLPGIAADAPILPRETEIHRFKLSHDQD